MSRRVKFTPEQGEVWLDLIMREGYCVIQRSPYHVQIFDRTPGTRGVDFWPTQCKWRDPLGFRDDREGAGFESLMAYLRENFPLGALA